MLFSEIYGSYFNVITAVLAEASEGCLTERRITCILSSNNPWFCQSKFLGIATEIPW